jgi:hypothetical protein
LCTQGVDVRYVRVLAKLYRDQVGYISLGDTLSKPFEINRGTKQGDPLSPALFNAVLENVLRKIKPAWHEKGYGVAVGENDAGVLTNLRFADDLLLVASSKKQIKGMLGDLVTSAREVSGNPHE